ncbi:hypothetical protein D3C77_385400 [compost metagenome]
MFGEGWLVQALRYLDLATGAIGSDHRLPLRVMFEGRAHAAHPSLVKTGGHQQLVGGEQGFVALVVIYLKGAFTLVAVAPQLVDGRGQRFRDRRALALHHHQRDAIHQQHQIGDDEGLAAVEAGRAIDAVLVDHREAVVSGCIPVNVVNRLATPAVPAGQALHGQTAD